MPRFIRKKFVFAVMVSTVVSGLPLSLHAQGVVPVEASHIVESIRDYRRQNEARILDDFATLLSLPNDASSPQDMQVNAEHIVSLLKTRGFSTRILGAGGAPYVYGELLNPTAAETILVYAHFDGQPVQEENWAYPPYSPTLLDAPLQAGGEPLAIDAIDGRFDPEWRLYARSAGDDKMPIIALLHVLDAMKRAGLSPSVNLKVLFDGEEERGSPTVGALLREYGDLLDADLMLFCDGPMHPSRRTQLVFGVRGGLNFDITTYGATRPLHSGHYGNWAPNPIMRLSYLLTSMRDESGRILIDNFYDDVAQLGELERDVIASMPDVEASLKRELSVHTPEGGGMRLEELVTLPALNVRGIVAGGVGDKGRNIILSSATAAINLRLVPNQRPDEVRELVEAHVRNEGFHIVYQDPSPATLGTHEKVAKLEWRGAGYPGLRTAIDHPVSQRMIKVVRELSPDLIVTPGMGGGLPLHAFDSYLQIPIIVLPLANHDNNQHAENENIRLQNIWDAMDMYGFVLARFGE